MQSNRSSQTKRVSFISFYLNKSNSFILSMPKQFHQRRIARFEGNLPWVFSSQGDEPSKTEINDLQYVPQPHNQIKMLPLANLT
jgi:hypothetical protein